MKINIFEERFIEVENILAVKSFLKRIDDYEVKNDVLKLCIKIDLTYLDHNMTENFKSLSQPCEVILKNEMKVLAVNLISLDLCAVENRGVNVKYNIDIDYDFNEQAEVQELVATKEDAQECVVKEEIEEPNADELNDFNDIEINQAEDVPSLDESKKIQEKYQEMLGDIVKTREDNTEIIEVVHNDDDSFLSLFDNFSSKYLKITKLYVNDKAMLMEKYNLNEEEFSKCYDSQSNILTIRSYD
jgi:hypothetical protein